MTPEQIELVRSSYASLDDASAMASDFYRRLFGIDPSARRLFSQDPAVMAEKFAAELGAIVQAIISLRRVLRPAPSPGRSASRCRSATATLRIGRECADASASGTAGIWLDSRGRERLAPRLQSCG